jgi:GntR family transcriptional regulator
MRANGNPPSRLDTRSGVPLYLQLREILQEEIVSLAPGEQLRSETEITARFRVSRSTVRQAFAELEQDGLVERRRGAGTFVAHRREMGWQIQSERGWYEDMTRRGHQIVTTLLERSIEVPPRWVCDGLELPPGTPVIQLDRVRSIDGTMATFVRNYLHPDICARVLDDDFDGGSSLYAWLETNCDLWVSGGTRTIRSVSASSRLAKRLEIRRGSPLLLVEAISGDSDAGTFEVYECWHRADLTSITVSVVPSAPSRP